MKQITLLIGIVLSLVLCITTVAAVTGDDFEVVIDKSGYFESYTYLNVNNPDELYTDIYTYGTCYLHSLVTFKPANIQGAPVMMVDTDKCGVIHLPRSVDDWEIKYYSSFESLSYLDPKYLKNSGVVNLNQFFGKYISEGLTLELSQGQFIILQGYPWAYFHIPDVD